MCRAMTAGLGLTVLSVLWVLLSGVPAPAGAANQSNTIRIGVVETLFRNVPKPMALAATQPLRALLESQTGFRGDVSAAGDVDTLARLLHEDKVDLVVFHGVEFGWARLKHPELRPLLIAVNGSRHLRAHVLVRKDSAASAWADLKGKPVAIPRSNREHCRLYWERVCQGLGQEPRTFFGELKTPGQAEESLDDLVDGTVGVVVVDGAALDCYKDRKPNRFVKLKEIDKSDVFPAGVIVYHPGGLEESKLRRVREGMIAANQTAAGRQLLTLWRLSGFEAVPADYDQTLINILKTYPPPAGTK